MDELLEDIAWMTRQDDIFGEHAQKEVLNCVEKELTNARKNWGRFNSAHEGYGVLKEEFDELWDHVKTHQKKRDLIGMKKEAIQVAAMACRFAIEICNEEIGRK